MYESASEAEIRCENLDVATLRKMWTKLVEKPTGKNVKRCDLAWAEQREFIGENRQLLDRRLSNVKTKAFWDFWRVSGLRREDLEPLFGHCLIRGTAVSKYLTIYQARLLKLMKENPRLWWGRPKRRGFYRKKYAAQVAALKSKKRTKLQELRTALRAYNRAKRAE